MSQATVLFDAPGPRARARNRILSVVGALIFLGMLGWLGWFLWDRNQITGTQWAPIFGRGAWEFYLLPGLRATVVSAFFAVIISLVLGFVGAMARLSDLKAIRWPATALIEFFRAVPVLIMMIFASNFLLRYVGFVSSDNRPLVAVVIGLVCYNSAVIAEVIRNGVASLPAGQREAGFSIGLRPSQVRRLILVPQAMTAMLPTLVSQLVVILKDSALGFIILYPELLRAARSMGTQYSNTFVALLVAAIIFILINWCLTKVAEWLEGRLRRRGTGKGKGRGKGGRPEAPTAAPGAPGAGESAVGAGRATPGGGGL